jgi:hypothetical protein
VDAEDEKLLTLARAARARAHGLAAGAAVRDEIGRTYQAAAVAVGKLQLGALELAVAMAVSSGVQRLEAVAVDGEEPGATALSALAALGDPTVLRA